MVRRLKVEVAARLAALATPHMWESGYLCSGPLGAKKYIKILCWRNKSGDSRTFNFPAAYDDKVRYLSGFYYDPQESVFGIFDAHGGGMLTIPAATLALEDLFRLERRLIQTLNNKRIPLFKQKKSCTTTSST